MTNKKKSPKLIIFLCWLVYTVAYLGRYSYSANINSIKATFNVANADAGLVTTCFFFAYGLGQIINGIFCKYYNKRYLISIVLVVSSAINLSVYFGIGFVFYKYLWLVNGLVQSVLWSSLIDLLGANLTDSHYIDKSIVVMSSSAIIGTLIVYGLSALFVSINMYELMFIVSSVLLFAVAVFWFIGSKGYNVTDEEVVQTTTQAKGSLKKYIPLIITLMVFAAANNLVKDGLSTWLPVILKDKYGVEDGISILLTLVLPAFAIFSAMINNALLKKITSHMVLCTLYYGIAVILLIIITLLFDTPLWVLILIIFGILTLLMHAVNNVVTNNFPFAMKEYVNTGFLAGLLNGTCYVGSTVSSYGLGLIADNFGWKMIFYLFLAVSVLSVVIGGIGIRRKV